MMIKLKSPFLRLSLLVALAIGSGGAHALCLPAVCSCTVTLTNLAFGSYNPLAFGNTDSTSNIGVKCGGVVGLLIPFSMAISTGGGTFTTRQMVSGTNKLNYNLFTDNSYTTVWGDGTGSTQLPASGVTLDVAGLAPTQNYTVYGRLPGRQLTAVPGSYTDTLSVLVTYY